MAVNIVVATLKGETIIDESVIKNKITKWREWLWVNWEKKNDGVIYPTV